MAKLHNYYVLCPLLDQKSFLGVSEDRQSEYLVVTLGRNVVNKYRVSDQKQVCGWTSKEHITSAVEYDHQQNCYVAVINNNAIKMWKEDSDNLDKIKKCKFPTNILKIIPRSKHPSLIIFSGGSCASLPYALENRKNFTKKPILKDNETIVESVCYTNKGVSYVVHIVKNNKDDYEIVSCPLREEIGDVERNKLIRVRISREDDASVVGKLINVNEAKGRFAVYVLWSDSKMTSYNLQNKTWRTLGTVPWISTLHTVSIAWMGHNHLILFGSNTEQDGALIVAYNIVLGVGSCKYPMKMYTENAKLYCFNQRIVLEASNHIGVLPYVIEANRNLSSLLGSHEVTQDDYTEIADWDTPKDPPYQVPKEINELLKLGLTERSICGQLIPSLIEKGDVNKVFNVIKEFKDIPESVLVLLLNYAVNLIDANKADIRNRKEFHNFCTALEDHQCRFNFEFLRYLLQIPTSDALLIPYLRDGISLDSALFLMMYIVFLLTCDDVVMEKDEESKLFDWCIALMDAFYQQYLVTKDDKVTYVLDNVKGLVVDLVGQLLEVDKLLPILNTILNEKNIDDTQEPLSYDIQLMKI